MEPRPISTMQQVLAALGVTPGLLTDAQRQALDEQGYLVLLDAVPTAQVDRVRRLYDLAYVPGTNIRDATRYARRLLGTDPEFAAFLAHPALLACVWHILGRPFRAANLVGRNPQPGFGGQGLHMDCVDSGPGTPFQAVTAIGMIDEFTADNGATRVVPGSHLFRRAPHKSLAQPVSRHPEEVVITGSPGSILVFNAHLWHSGTWNRSQLQRRATQCSYVGREQKRSDLEDPCDPELPPAIRFLLGGDPR